MFNSPSTSSLFSQNEDKNIEVSIPPGYDLNDAFAPNIPEKLENKLLPVTSLDAGIIPEPLRPWVMDIARRMNCPPDYVAVSLIISVGAVIGTGCGIKPKQKDDWLIIPNLWGGVVGNPSQLKTPSINQALKPLLRLEAEAKELFNLELAAHKSISATNKAQADALKLAMKKAASAGQDMTTMAENLRNVEQEPEPKEKRFKTSDSTVEKLTELLKDNPRGLLVYRDELIGLLSSWEKAGREQDRAFYLEGWNGDSHHTCDRIARGTTHVDNCCISLLGSIQPTKLEAYLLAAAGNENDGFVQRLQLMVYPDPPDWKFIDEYPDQAAKNRVFEIVKKLADLNFNTVGATSETFDKIPYFRFSLEAQSIFNSWLARHEAKIRDADEQPLIAEHLAKYRSLIPSLAVIFHLVQLADTLCKMEGAKPEDILKVNQPYVGTDSIEIAVRWCDYLESHARRIYGMVRTPIKNAAFALSKKLLKKDLPDPFTAKDVYRHEWQGLTRAEIVKDAIEYLVAAKWLFENPQAPGTGGRPAASTYSINPLIFAK